MRKIVTFTKVLPGNIYSDGASSVGYKDMRRTCSQENTNEIQTKQEIIWFYGLVLEYPSQCAVNAQSKARAHHFDRC